MPNKEKTPARDMESGGPFADNAIAIPDGILGATIKSSRPNSRNVRACSRANASSCQYLGNSTNVPVGLHVAKKNITSNSIHSGLFFRATVCMHLLV